MATVDEGDFQTRWASPPGRTIQAVMQDRGLSTEVLVERLGVSHQGLEALLLGQERISLDLARLLSSNLGASIEFWITRDIQYQEDLLRMEADRWAQTLPIPDMANFGWIDHPEDWKDRITKSLDFFDVEDYTEYKARYAGALTNARFRTSPSIRSRPEAVLTWMRQSEILLERASVNQWDPSALREVLPQVRSLSKIRDPKSFVEPIQDLFAQAGVAVVLVRAPRGCAASGVSRYLGDERPSITLSARHLSDDHLWFTLFHEAAHLLLHDSRNTYLDDDDSLAEHEGTTAEVEANVFAGEALVPQVLLHELMSVRLEPRRILEFARDLGISPGIVIGQLQHKRVLNHETFLNRLKRRYRWDGVNLEKART